MSDFELDNGHLRTLTVIILHGNAATEGWLHPYFVKKAKELADNGYLDVESSEHREGKIVVYRLKEASLDAVNARGHNVLDAMLKTLIKK